ncbi:MAG: hypothetical protein K8Q89_06940 [Nitrosarchaeum sp.]|nr:hypothetical protein [Nitrosarchaeum sp.]
MKKRGPIIGVSGLILVVVSISIMVSVYPSSNVGDKNNLYLPSMFEGMFDKVSDNIQILPDESGYFSYGTQSSNVPLLWGVQIIDYHDGDKLSISISNIYGDSYGEFSQNTSVIFEMLQIAKSDTLNFEIQNHGPRVVNLVVMISEDPDNSNTFSNPNSPFVNTVLPLVISGILLILGIIILLVGVILYLIDWKNTQNDKRRY